MAPQREWFEKDYYKILGIAEGASQKEVTRAYRKLARKLHPDANPDDPQAEERFKEVSAAYDVVGDPDKRKEYDEVRKLGPVAAGFGGPGGPGGGPAAGSVRAASTSAWRTSATSATCSGACSTAAGGGVPRAASAPSGVRTSRPSCTWPSRTPPSASRRR